MISGVTKRARVKRICFIDFRVTIDFVSLNFWLSLCKLISANANEAFPIFLPITTAMVLDKREKGLGGVAGLNAVPACRTRTAVSDGRQQRPKPSASRLSSCWGTWRVAGGGGGEPEQHDVLEEKGLRRAIEVTLRIRAGKKSYCCSWESDYKLDYYQENAKFNLICMRQLLETKRRSSDPWLDKLSRVSGCRKPRASSSLQFAKFPLRRIA